MLKKTTLLNSIILLLFFVTSGYTFRSDASEKEVVVLAIVMEQINMNHYNKLKIDDDFSKTVFADFMEDIDYTKKFLLSSDLKKLKKFETLIDNELNDHTLEFFDLSTSIINERIIEAEGYYKDILAQPFDFSVDETIEIDGKKIGYATTKDELKDSWRKALKYQTMLQLYESIEIQEKAIETKDTAVKIKSFEELEADARKKTLTTNEEYFKSLKQVDRDDRFDLYVNTITNLYDPHTEFFAPKEKDDFDIRMSGKLEGIGATLRVKDSYITVESLVPGSPSWKQGELKAGDKILKVAQGNAEPVDIVGMRLDKAVQLIRGKKGTEVRLTVKKIDSRIVIISIIRDVIVIEESYAKSAIVMSKDGHRVGFVKLPSFYIDFNDRNGRACAKDIGIEIDKLNKEGVEGIVLDLRDNSGGSLQEVVTMGGFFIPRGPIVQVKQTNLPPHIMMDDDSRTQFNGPLIVMVNFMSASASEILAAAMQDYKRAIIIGTASTFGKGTVQRYFDLDPVTSAQFSKYKPLGAIKVTTQKFYRINGGATQLKGVIPDIIFPDVYTYMEIGEKEMKHALKWDEITPAIYLDMPPKYDRAKVITLSQKRIATDSTFILIDENAKRMKKQYDHTQHSLQFNNFKAYQVKLQEEAKKYKDILDKETGIKITSLSSEVSKTAIDSAYQERTANWHKSLGKDAYLFETIQVMDDMLRK